MQKKMIVKCRLAVFFSYTWIVYTRYIMKSIVLSLIVVCFFVGCIKHDSTEIEVDFSMAEKKDTFFVEDYFNCKIISLNNGKEILFEDIESVYIQDHIYIYDQSRNGKLIKIDTSNGVIIDITRIGNGPGEYPFISSIFVDSNIYVNSGPLLNIFNENNKLIDKFNSIKLQSHHFLVKDSIMYCSYNFGSKLASRYPELFLYNLKNDESKKLLPFLNLGEDKENRMRTSLSQHLTLNESGEVLFSRLYENIIYKIENDIIKKNYLISLPETSGFIWGNDQKYSNNLPKYVLVDFMETSNILYLNIWDLKQRDKYLLRYNKSSGNSERFSVIWSRKLRTRLVINKISEGNIIGEVSSTKVKYLRKKAFKVFSARENSTIDLDWANSIEAMTSDQFNPILFIMNEKDD